MSRNLAFLCGLVCLTSLTATAADRERPLHGEIVRLTRDAAELQTDAGSIVSIPLNSTTYVYEQQTVVALYTLTVGAEVQVVRQESRSKGAPVTYTMIYILKFPPGRPGF